MLFESLGNKGYNIWPTGIYPDNYSIVIVSNEPVEGKDLTVPASTGKWTLEPE